VAASDRNRVFSVADIAVGDVTFHVLDQFTAESDSTELWTGADPKHGHVIVLLQHQPSQNQVRSCWLRISWTRRFSGKPLRETFEAGEASSDRRARA
jgi:hypothetical protein